MRGPDTSGRTPHSGSEKGEAEIGTVAASKGVKATGGGEEQISLEI